MSVDVRCPNRRPITPFGSHISAQYPLVLQWVRKYCIHLHPFDPHIQWFQPVDQDLLARLGAQRGVIKASSQVQRLQDLD